MALTMYDAARRADAVVRRVSGPLRGSCLVADIAISDPS